MSAIGPGDWVECVRLSPTQTMDTGFLSVGSIYQVKSVGHRCLGSDGVIRPSIRLVGDGDDDDGSFRVDLFCPIYRPKADLIESLKTPAKREKAPA